MSIQQDMKEAHEESHGIEQRKPELKRMKQACEQIPEDGTEHAREQKQVSKREGD